MHSELILIHRPGSQGSATLAESLAANVPTANLSDWFVWQTCLRQLAITDDVQFDGLLLDVPAEVFAEDEIYRGDEAFRFLLQVICGLHSPLIGETEVYGQFKNAVGSFGFPGTPFGQRLRRFVKHLFEDAKAVRQKHLEELGSQSYGSVVRRELKGLARVDVVGAGQLVEEILPWIAKEQTQIRVFNRDPASAKSRLGNRPRVSFFSLAQSRPMGSANAVMIAAPLPAREIAAWLLASDCDDVRIVIDLRADSATDAVMAHLPPEVRARIKFVDLTQVFARIADNQIAVQARKLQALESIERAVLARNQHVEYRPFGWEDVCA